MYQKILTPRTTPVITPETLAEFGRFDVPQSSPVSVAYELLETFIEAATDEVETVAAWACENEQVLLTLDFFPNTQDPRNFLQYELSYAFAITPWWWWGFPTKDSIELVRRPVIVPTFGRVLNITAVSVANNILTVHGTGTLPAVGDVVLLQGTAEGNNANPQATPSTTPFLNGAQVTVLTSGSGQFTASFVLGGIGSDGTFVPSSFTNASDTGSATVITNPLIVTYYDQNGILQTWNTTNYFVQYDKICLTVGNWWPLTDRRQDCIQISYWAGETTTPDNVGARLQMAIMFLANHFWENRSIISVEPTSEVGLTLCRMLSSYRSYRIAR